MASSRLFLDFDKLARSVSHSPRAASHLTLLAGAGLPPPLSLFGLGGWCVPGEGRRGGRGPALGTPSR